MYFATRIRRQVQLDCLRQLMLVRDVDHRAKAAHHGQLFLNFKT